MTTLPSLRITALMAILFLVLTQTSASNRIFDSARNRSPASRHRSHDIKRCINIHELANGQVTCAYSGCRMRCQPGYVFIGSEDAGKVSLSCDHHTGKLFFRGDEWNPSMTVCSPKCSTACQNGGTCASPDTCSCRSGYTGKHCESELMLGDAPYGGYQLAKLAHNQRRVECPDGSRMPDGSTSVTLTYRDNHYFYPDGRVLLGVGEVTCSEVDTPSPPKPLPPISNKPLPSQTPRPLPLIRPTPGYVTAPPRGGQSTGPQYVCTPTCANGGVCVYTNKCSCPRGFWGPRCLTRVCTYPRFESNLHASLGGTLRRMRFECHKGYRTAEGRERVEVQCHQGQWRLIGGKPLVEDDVRCL